MAADPTGSRADALPGGLTAPLPRLSRPVATMRRVSGGVLIIGGGLAAQRAVETLRARGHHGPIRVVCGEPVAPYDRPPLSKQLLLSGGDPSFRPGEWYEAQEGELLLGRAAAAPRVRGGGGGVGGG